MALKEAISGHCLENANFAPHSMLNLLALQIIEADINFNGGCAFIYNLLNSLNNSSQS